MAAALGAAVWLGGRRSGCVSGWAAPACPAAWFPLVRLRVWLGGSRLSSWLGAMANVVLCRHDWK